MQHPGISSRCDDAIMETIPTNMAMTKVTGDVLTEALSVRAKDPADDAANTGNAAYRQHQ